MLEKTLKIRYTLFIALFLFAFQSCKTPIPFDIDYSRSYSEWSLNQMGLIQFDYEVLNFYGDGKNRVDLYLQVSYDKLPFIKEEGVFKVDYSYRIIIFTEGSENIIIDKEFDKKIIRPDWKEEYSQYFDYCLNSFDLLPGDYYVCVMVKEKNSSSYNYKMKKIKIKDVSKSDISLSDVLVLRELSQDKNGIHIQPAISSNIPYLDNDTIYTFNEINFNKKLNNIKVSYSLEKLFYREDRTFMTPFDSYRYSDTYSELPGKIYNRTLLFQKDTIIKNPSSKLFLAYPLISKQGNFNISIKISDQDTGVAEKSTDLKIYPLGFPKLVSINDKVNALRYILKPSEIKQFDTLQNLNARKEFLEKILKTMTPDNVNEYFSRVQYANERFTANVEGYRTILGMIYIICGEPYEVFQNSWYYVRYGELLELKIYELQQRDKYPILPRTCYIQDIPDNFITYWWDCIDKIRQ